MEHAQQALAARGVTDVQLHLLLANQLDVPLSCEDVALTGLAIDSRQVKPGDLFAAIDGATVNGNDFIDAAIANGAAASSVSSQWLSQYRRYRSKASKKPAQILVCS